eukprot:SAG25_NODE_2568_length_1528_cov_1.195241_1_plen_170_part_00
MACFRAYDSQSWPWTLFQNDLTNRTHSHYLCPGSRTQEQRYDLTCATVCHFCTLVSDVKIPTHIEHLIEAHQVYVHVLDRIHSQIQLGEFPVSSIMRSLSTVGALLSCWGSESGGVSMEFANSESCRDCCCAAKLCARFGSPSSASSARMCATSMGMPGFSISSSLMRI